MKKPNTIKKAQVKEVSKAWQIAGRKGKERKTLTPAELKFVKEFSISGNFTQACRIAYPNLKDANVYGSSVAAKPHIKPLIDKIKQNYLDSIDDNYIVNHYQRKIERFEKKKEEDPDPTLDQEHFSLKALNGLAAFKKKNEVQGTTQILINIDGALMGSTEGKIIKQ